MIVRQSYRESQLTSIRTYGSAALLICAALFGLHCGPRSPPRSASQAASGSPLDGFDLGDSKDTVLAAFREAGISCKSESSNKVRCPQPLVKRYPITRVTLTFKNDRLFDVTFFVPVEREKSVQIIESEYNRLAAEYGSPQFGGPACLADAAAGRSCDLAVSWDRPTFSAAILATFVDGSAGFFGYGYNVRVDPAASK